MRACGSQERPRRGVGIEAPQQHSAVGFPQLVEIAG